ncbi:hypothetical protein OHB53_23015 [Streptomyces sp. NBC_00056]
MDGPASHLTPLLGAARPYKTAAVDGPALAPRNLATAESITTPA